MKKCAYCAEQIQDAAIKCRYCGSMLNPAATGGQLGRAAMLVGMLATAVALYLILAHRP